VGLASRAASSRKDHAINPSTGDSRAIEIRAEGAAKATRLTAGAAAEVTRLEIAGNQLKLIPDVYVSGGGGASGNDNSGLMSLALLQYLTGRQVMNPASAANTTPR
jgi:hypothetical protein